jgi:hypothetical protein
MKTLRSLNYLLRCTLVILAIFSLTTCQKEIVSPQKIVAQAQNYFESQILTDTTQKVQDNNPRHSIAKEPLWAEASLQNMSFGQAVVVPLAYQQAIALQTQSGNIPLGELSYLLIYKDAQKQYHTEVVTKLPEKNYWPNCKNPNISFKGVILVEDWWGNTLKNISLGIAGPENLLGYVAPQAKGQIPPNNNLMLAEQFCYSQVWQITVCGGGAEGCTTHYDISQVCFTVYTDTGPSGGGGGGGNWSGLPTGPDYGNMPHGGGGGYNTPPPPSQAFMDKINDSQLKPCMKSVLNSIKTLSNGSLAGIIQKFAGETPGFNWTLIDEALPPNWNGSTNPIYNAGTVTTTFDNQKFTHASDLAIARTILHESVHAYLVASFKNDPTAYLLNYGQLMKKWQDMNGSLNDFQHDLMTKNFIVDIGIALKEYGASKGYNLTDQFYNDLAWGGLDGTTTFMNLSNSDKTRIMNVILVEQTGFDSLGEQKVRKGKLSSCYDIGVE